MSLLLCGLLSGACSDGEVAETPAEPPAWPRGHLVDVAVPDPGRVVVIAENGEIHWSPDAGRSWRPSRVPAGVTLRGLSMSDPEHGWAVGEGVILRTDDGGVRWRRQRLPGRAAGIRLLAVSAIDRESAVAVGEAGVVLRTRDAGGLWEFASPIASGPGRAGETAFDVFCHGGGATRCWMAGAEIRVSDDLGASWQNVGIEDPVSFEPLGFDFGEVELTDPGRDRLLAFIEDQRGRSHSTWRIEPRVARDEIEQIGRRRDPEALFDLIAARLLEVRSQLEEAGIPEDRIFVYGTPPWDYADSLDDDPDLLERYWAERSAPTSEIVVRVVEEAVFHALCVEDRGVGLAVGEAGALARSRDRGAHWRMAERISPHDLLAVGSGRGGFVAVGAQGGLWLSSDEGRSWRRPDLAAVAPFFETLHALAFSPSGEIGIIVGDRGLLLRSLDGGDVWERLEAAAP